VSLTDAYIPLGSYAVTQVADETGHFIVSIHRGGLTLAERAYQVAPVDTDELLDRAASVLATSFAVEVEEWRISGRRSGLTEEQRESARARLKEAVAKMRQKEGA
jgi:hypothetical protein